MAYSKLFASIINSSLWTEPDHIRLIFITMLAIADRDGYVYGSRAGLIRQACVDMDACDETDPFAVLMAPDRESSDLLRNPDNEGRRIEEVEQGFRIINYGYYRSLRNDDDRRIQNREAQRRFKAKSKPQSAKVSRAKPQSAHAEAEADTEEKKKKESPSLREIEDFCQSIGLPKSDAEAMLLHWTERKWPKSWQLTIRKWKSFGYMPSQKQRNGRITKLPAPSGPAYRRVDPPPPEMSDEEFARQQKIVRDGCAQFKKTMRHE